MNEERIQYVKKAFGVDSEERDYKLWYHLEPSSVSYDDIWMTAKQAAKALNVTEREIDEKYRNRMPPGTVTEAEYEYRYWWEFQQEGHDWGGYDREKLSSQNAWLAKVYPRFKGPAEVSVEFDQGSGVEREKMTMMPCREDGYDELLEPNSRRNVEVRPRLYLWQGLLHVRAAMASVQATKPVQARGAGGRFTKKT